MSIGGNVKKCVAAIAVLACLAAMSSLSETITLIRAGHGEYCHAHAHEHSHNHSHGHDRHDDRDRSSDQNSAGGCCPVCAVLKIVADSRALFKAAAAVSRVDFENTLVLLTDIDSVSAQFSYFSPVAARVRLNN